MNHRGSQWLPYEFLSKYIQHYTVNTDCAITTDLPVKFCTAHGRLRSEVGSRFPIEAYGSRGDVGILAKNNCQ